jgi:hypothetical protein
MLQPQSSVSRAVHVRPGGVRFKRVHATHELGGGVAALRL